LILLLDDREREREKTEEREKIKRNIIIPRVLFCYFFLFILCLQCVRFFVAFQFFLAVDSLFYVFANASVSAIARKSKNKKNKKFQPIASQSDADWK
jgi:archaellum biogenesis protein FlaJ (TadC family)